MNYDNRTGRFCPLFSSYCMSVNAAIGAWQGVAMDYLKYHYGHALPSYALCCGQATLEMVLEPFQGRRACRACSLQSCFTLLDTLHLSPMSPNDLRLWGLPGFTSFAALN
jgi:hypothetical protein